MSAKGYTAGTWSGLPQFICERCGYGVADKSAEKAEGTIRRHVAEHLGVPADAVLSDDAQDEAEGLVLDFASDAAADAFEALDEDVRDEVAKELLGRKPSGLTGAFTVADVRDAVAAAKEE